MVVLEGQQDVKLQQGGGGAGYFGKRKSREKWSEKRKSFQNQRQPAAEIGALPVENSIIIYCFSQVLHFLTDSIRYFGQILGQKLDGKAEVEEKIDGNSEILTPSLPPP